MTCKYRAISAQQKEPPVPNPLRIKPHHFVDIVCDYGLGQPALEPCDYGHALHIVTAQIIADPNIPLIMELGADDICAPCRHNIAGQCDDTIGITDRPAAPASKLAYNLLIDSRWCELLGIAQGTQMTAAQFCTLLCRPIDDLIRIYREEPADYAPEKHRALMLGIARLIK
jgi:hypothetical protein